MRFIFAYVLVLTLWNVHAQTAPEPVNYEVASYKPREPEVSSLFVQPLPGGSLRITGGTVKNLLAIRL